MSKAAELISLMFFARNFTHREHLRTTVYARHMALGQFYEAIVDLADKFAETYQGRYDLIQDVSLDQVDFEGDSLALLQKQMEWIDSNRHLIAPTRDTSIQNVLDEIVGQYAHTIYKYRTLM